MLSQDHWTEAKRLYHDALALDTGDRDAFLRAACGDDTRLLTEVCSLLAWNADADGFLDTPVARLGGLADASRPASVRGLATLGSLAPFVVTAERDNGDTILTVRASAGTAEGTLRLRQGRRTSEIEAAFVLP